MNIAFVTYKGFPDLTADDKTLAGYLAGKNIRVDTVLWDDEQVSWLQYDAIVLRSTWDYFDRVDEFDAWLQKLEQLNCRVFNPVPVMQWNKNKNYFIDFSQKGIQLPPYHYCLKNNGEKLVDILKKNNWAKAVVKPSVSGGALNTWVTELHSASADEASFAELLQNGDVIVQKFMDEIVTEGELSLVFFNKKFSHAICKRAKQGDFRVQTQFGGVATPFEPDELLLQQSLDLLKTINEPLLYARVDGIIVDGQFNLMELELIEPVLSVYSNENACENFYIALCELMS